MSLSCQSLSLSKHSNYLIHSAPVSLTVFFAFFAVFFHKSQIALAEKLLNLLIGGVLVIIFNNAAVK